MYVRNHFYTDLVNTFDGQFEDEHIVCNFSKHDMG